MQEIQTLHLFPKLNHSLISLLGSLTQEEWLTPSPIEGRTVKDLASHLLDGSIRRLSQQRDQFFPGKPVVYTYHDLVEYIQTINKEWILASRKISPQILVELLKIHEREVYELFQTLDPNEPAIFPVAWAGETQSPNWFDIAREYTEKWHHQMQIRLSLDKSLMMDRSYVQPLYKTFMMGLPYALKEASDFPDLTALKVSISGHYSESWQVVKQNGLWIMENENSSPVQTEITIPEEVGWIIFTNTDRDKQKYIPRMDIKGNEALAQFVVNMVTVMS
jgi:hypothetical protein